MAFYLFDLQLIDHYLWPSRYCLPWGPELLRGSSWAGIQHHPLLSFPHTVFYDASSCGVGPLLPHHQHLQSSVCHLPFSGHTYGRDALIAVDHVVISIAILYCLKYFIVNISLPKKITVLVTIIIDFAISNSFGQTNSFFGEFLIFLTFL